MIYKFQWFLFAHRMGSLTIVWGRGSWIHCHELTSLLPGIAEAIIRTTSFPVEVLLAPLLVLLAVLRLPSFPRRVAASFSWVCRGAFQVRYLTSMQVEDNEFEICLLNCEWAPSEAGCDRSLCCPVPISTVCCYDSEADWDSGWCCGAGFSVAPVTALIELC